MGNSSLNYTEFMWDVGNLNWIQDLEKILPGNTASAPVHYKGLGIIILVHKIISYPVLQ